MNRWKLIMLRKALKMTQDDLGKELGISGVSYRAKEKGDREFTEKEIIRIMEIFNQDANYFFAN